MRIVSGSSSEQIYFVAFSTFDHITRIADHTTAGFSVFFSKAGTTGTTAAVAFTNINSTQMPGVYSLSLLDSTLTALPAGIDSRELCIHISGSMDAVTRTVELYRRTVTTGLSLALNSSGEPTNVMTALSSIATTLGTIGTKVTSVDSRLTSMDTMLSSVNAKVTSVDSRLSSMDTMLSSVNAKVTSIDTDIDTALSRLTSIDANTTAIIIKLTSHDTTLAAIGTKVTSVDTDIDTALVRLTSIDTKVTAIQAQTTQLAFNSGAVSANIHYVNNVQVQGTGSTVDIWRPV